MNLPQITSLLFGFFMSVGALCGAKAGWPDVLWVISGVMAATFIGMFLVRKQR